VTPLQDGMNLVAKEFVAAQDSEDPGVLVLSRFAGAAEQLRDALIVNPYDPDEIADAMHAALEMPLEERKRRHESVREAVFQGPRRSFVLPIWTRSRLFRWRGNCSHSARKARGSFARPVWRWWRRTAR
jgi:hypothetical protein